MTFDPVPESSGHSTFISFILHAIFYRLVLHAPSPTTLLRINFVLHAPTGEHISPRASPQVTLVLEPTFFLARPGRYQFNRGSTLNGHTLSTAPLAPKRLPCSPVATSSSIAHSADRGLRRHGSSGRLGLARPQIATPA